MPDDPIKAELFYADPVDADGNKIGTANFKLTKATGMNVTVTKIPYDEMGVDENTPTIRPWEGLRVTLSKDFSVQTMPVI